MLQQFRCGIITFNLELNFTEQNEAYVIIFSNQVKKRMVFMLEMAALCVFVPTCVLNCVETEVWQRGFWVISLSLSS